MIHKDYIQWCWETDKRLGPKWFADELSKGGVDKFAAIHIKKQYFDAKNWSEDPLSQEIDLWQPYVDYFGSDEAAGRYFEAYA